MELLSPAGSIEKLRYAYRYGADAAYIGVHDFSLRQKAENFRDGEHEEIRRIKGGRKLYCAMNIYFHNEDLRRLEEQLDYVAEYPFDAFIVSDLGIVPMLRRRFPDIALHLSTQANCVNAEAARFYRDLGFSRIILGRELSLREISEIRGAVPDLELEVFVHGAMCLAYSGRCLLSAWMAGRSANRGSCSHSCRWEFRVLEERERPGEYYPVQEGEGFSTILSSKDLCMIDHLQELRDAGVDSVKIEGRMKSIYYTAVVTRAYRKQIDALTGRSAEDPAPYREELFRVSHREMSTGFFFGDPDAVAPTGSAYTRPTLFLGSVIRALGDGVFEIDVKNGIRSGEPIEYLGPDVPVLRDSDYRLLDEEMQKTDRAVHGRRCHLRTEQPIEEGFILRRRSVDPT